jgi:hypothetical protein
MDPLLNRTDREVGVQAQTMFAENAIQAKQLLACLPTNRELINKIHKYGLQKI